MTTKDRSSLTEWERVVVEAIENDITAHCPKCGMDRLVQSIANNTIAEDYMIYIGAWPFTDMVWVKFYDCCTVGSYPVSVLYSTVLRCIFKGWDRGSNS